MTAVEMTPKAAGVNGSIFTEDNALPIDIDELMICSAAGDVYHAWQCENTELRINLLEFLSQKAAQIQNAVACGNFDRTEFITSGARLIAQIRPEGCAVVRASLSGTATAKNDGSPASIRPSPPQVRTRALQWLEKQLELPGLFAATLQFPDRTGPSHCIPEITAEALELLGRTINEGFQVLKLQRLYGQRARWLFEHIALECAQWRDGTVMGFVFDRNTIESTKAAVEQQLQGFLLLEEQP